MDLQKLITIFSFALAFIFFLLMLVKISKKSKTTHSVSPLPPSPFKLPLIGHLHHLLGGLPHHKLKDLANKHGPIIYLKLGEVSLVVISSPGIANQIMKTHDLMFADRPFNLASDIATYGSKDIVMSPYGEYWRKIRMICVTELLSPKKVQSFWSMREEEVSNLVGKLSTMIGQEMNLSKKISTLTNDIVARAAFGKMFKDKETFLLETKQIITITSTLSVADLFLSLKFLEKIGGIKSKVETVHQKIDKILEDIIKQHKDNINSGVEEDIVDVLLRVQKSGELEIPLTMDNIKAILFDMFIGGTDTSSTVLEWTFKELLRNPRVMEKAQAEVREIFNGKKKINQADIDKLNYLRLVIKESLRLHPPLPLLIPRECKERCEVEGYEIPKGCKVLVNVWGMGRDPENWKDPENFDPERFQDGSIDYKGTNFMYIPFGAGRRMCPGVLFGVANVELPLALLLYHFNWKLPNGVKPEDVDMMETLDGGVVRKQNLLVIPTSYNPL